MNHTVCDDEFARPYNAWAWHILPVRSRSPPRSPYGQGPHPPPPHPGVDPYQSRRDARRHDGSAAVANVVRVVTGTVAVIFLLHILFVVFDANQGNGFVHGVYSVAKALVLGLGDVFTPTTPHSVLS